MTEISAPTAPDFEHDIGRAEKLIRGGKDVGEVIRAVVVNVLNRLGTPGTGRCPCGNPSAMCVACYARWRVGVQDPVPPPGRIAQGRPWVHARPTRL